MNLSVKTILPLVAAALLVLASCDSAESSTPWINGQWTTGPQSECCHLDISLHSEEAGQLSGMGTIITPGETESARGQIEGTYGKSNVHFAFEGSGMTFSFDGQRSDDPGYVGISGTLEGEGYHNRILLLKE